MGAYIIKRLLLMIPTFFGILIITFVILRLNAVSLTDEMNKAIGSGNPGAAEGARKAEGASHNLENYIDRFRRSGNDLPALVNLRGFWTKDTVLRLLRDADPSSGRPAPQRSATEKKLWLAGHFAVAPLAEILADPADAPLWPAAARAFSLCAYTTIDEDSRHRLSDQALLAVQDRNDVLRNNVFTAEDPAREAKRQALLRVYRQQPDAWAHGRSAAWRAIFVETGFVDIMGKLFTGRLWSESKQQYCFTLIGQRWYISAGLNTTSVLLSWLVSIPLGIRAARVNGSIEERATTNLLFLLWSIPSFFLGTILLHHLCVGHGGHAAWFPNRGLPGEESFWYTTPRYLVDLAWHAALPLVVLTYSSFTVLSRYMRGNLLDQMSTEYVRTARAKGASDDRVVYRHAVPNSMLTMITLGSSLLADLFGGFVIVEFIFSIPGLGTLTLEAAQQFDAPLIMASTLISVGLLLVGILIADLLYGVVDPRLRSRYG